ncbi:MAG: hypothetical protein IJQ82_05905 [Selenomonadaceae bacterium]|nr:hypothetical protein [Selenomonadaceae bacterium]
MKKLACISIGVLTAFLSAFVVPTLTDANVAHAAFYKCNKCGHGTSASNPNKGNQNCPKGGYHNWVREG